MAPDTSTGSQEAVVVALVGDLDAQGCDAAWNLLEESSRSAGGTVVVDLSRVTFMDSSGLSMLLRLAQGLRADGDRAVVLRGADGAVRRLLTLTSMDSIFELQH